ncbi:helix-turn-helix transcriptional regulator [Pseudomonas putida]|nr:hypothetical protein [Pseudomonas putida]
MSRDQVMPRILRYRDAPEYLGMCRQEFNRTVRPFVAEFRIGVRGVGFDRYELDAWADEYIAATRVQKEPRQQLKQAARDHEQQSIDASKQAFEDAVRLATGKKLRRGAQ